MVHNEILGRVSDDGRGLLEFHGYGARLWCAGLTDELPRFMDDGRLSMVKGYPILYKSRHQ